jgi:transposase
MHVTIDVDAYKKTHTMVALDAVGRRPGESTVPTTTDGHLAAVQWASQWAVDGQVVRFAVEDCRHLTRRLEGDLLRAGQQVVRVHTRLMADARRSVRRPGKSDPIDAEAVALAALREPDLPVAQLDGPAREVKLLVDTRADLVVQRTQAASRLRWYLHELDPALQVPSRGLRRHCVVAELAERLADEQGLVARLARNLLARIGQLNNDLNAFEREIRDRVRTLVPTLLKMPGCGVLSAAVLLGESADVRPLPFPRRLRPLHRHRAHPGLARQQRPSTAQPRGQPHRQLCAPHDRGDASRGVGDLGKAYVDKKISAGKTKREALRLLRRHLSDAAFTGRRQLLLRRGRADLHGAHETNARTRTWLPTTPARSARPQFAPCAMRSSRSRSSGCTPRTTASTASARSTPSSAATASWARAGSGRSRAAPPSD